MEVNVILIYGAHSIKNNESMLKEFQICLCNAIQQLKRISERFVVKVIINIDLHSLKKIEHHISDVRPQISSPMVTILLNLHQQGDKDKKLFKYIHISSVLKKLYLY